MISGIKKLRKNKLVEDLSRRDTRKWAGFKDSGCCWRSPIFGPEQIDLLARDFR